MMQLIVNYLWNIVAAAGVIACLIMAARIWLKFPDRTTEDVIDFLIPIDLEKVESLLDPATEWTLRRSLDPKDFRRRQRKRIHLYVEFLQRMAHNAGILVQLGNREADRADQATAELARELQQEAVKVRAYTLAAAAKLRLWLFLRIDSWGLFPSPSLCDVREVGGLSCVESYGQLKAAATHFFERVGPSKVDLLLQRL